MSPDLRIAHQGVSDEQLPSGRWRARTLLAIRPKLGEVAFLGKIEVAAGVTLAVRNGVEKHGLEIRRAVAAIS